MIKLFDVFKPKFVGGNMKLGNMFTWSVLMGNKEIYIDKLGCTVKGSCGDHCTGCEKACYVRKSYRYPSVKFRHAINTLAMRTDINRTFEMLDKQLTRKRKKVEVVRINQSGEIENTTELYKWNELATKHPESVFYIYTKNYKALASFLYDCKSNVTLASNFIINISVWHESGITPYKCWSEIFPENIKAFVYVDGFDYESQGITVKSMCMAYDKNGKINHNVTCDKCRKCFRYSENTRINGCYDHS